MENKNYKVRCVGYNRDERYFTVGKVYDVVNGTITNDNGFTYNKVNHEKDVIKHLDFWYKFERVEDAHKIVITTDGKTNTARLFNGKELIRKAEAKCSPDDTFDFMVGAKLAMERLEGKKPEKQTEKFTPHLECAGKHYGNIGEKTNYKDAIGRALRIGDTIELYDSTTLKYFGEEAIVNDGKAFVMGCACACTAETGATRGWKIIKKRSFEDVGNGEKVGAIKYIKEV